MPYGFSPSSRPPTVTLRDATSSPFYVPAGRYSVIGSREGNHVRPAGGRLRPSDRGRFDGARRAALLFHPREAAVRSEANTVKASETSSYALASGRLRGSVIFLRSGRPLAATCSYRSERRYGMGSCRDPVCSSRLLWGHWRRRLPLGSILLELSALAPHRSPSFEGRPDRIIAVARQGSI